MSAIIAALASRHFPRWTGFMWGVGAGLGLARWHDGIGYAPQISIVVAVVACFLFSRGD